MWDTLSTFPAPPGERVTSREKHTGPEPLHTPWDEWLLSHCSDSLGVEVKAGLEVGLCGLGWREVSCSAWLCEPHRPSPRVHSVAWGTFLALISGSGGGWDNWELMPHSPKTGFNTYATCTFNIIPSDWKHLEMVLAPGFKRWHYFMNI